jgi:hypothetical protein
MSTPAMATFADTKAKIATLQAEAKAAAQAAFTEGTRALFEAFPAMESFGWTQYSPYFNDGDECVFSAKTDYPNINGEESYDTPEADAVGEFLGLFGDDFLKSLYGNHVEVTVTRNGQTNVEEYQHD